MPRSSTRDFSKRYGPWAVVAGASQGLGEAYAEQLASRGLHLVLIARRAALLDDIARRLTAAHGIETRGDHVSVVEMV